MKHFILRSDSRVGLGDIEIKAYAFIKTCVVNLTFG